MVTDKVVLMSQEDLSDFVESMFYKRFSDKTVDVKAASQILNVSIDTINRWVKANLLHTDNTNQIKREVRKFSLSYLLKLDVDTLKKQYRLLNK